MNSGIATLIMAALVCHPGSIRCCEHKFINRDSAGLHQWYTKKDAGIFWVFPKDVTHKFCDENIIPKRRPVSNAANNYGRDVAHVLIFPQGLSDQINVFSAQGFINRIAEVFSGENLLTEGALKVGPHVINNGVFSFVHANSNGQNLALNIDVDCWRWPIVCHPHSNNNAGRSFGENKMARDLGFGGQPWATTRNKGFFGGIRGLSGLPCSPGSDANRHGDQEYLNASTNNLPNRQPDQIRSGFSHAELLAKVALFAGLGLIAGILIARAVWLFLRAMDGDDR